MAKDVFAGTAMLAAARPWVLPEYGDRFR
jgi:hypothetical protein